MVLDTFRTERETPFEQRGNMNTKMHTTGMLPVEWVYEDTDGDRYKHMLITITVKLGRRAISVGT